MIQNTCPCIGSCRTIDLLSTEVSKTSAHSFLHKLVSFSPCLTNRITQRRLFTWITKNRIPFIAWNIIKLIEKVDSISFKAYRNEVTREEFSQLSQNDRQWVLNIAFGQGYTNFTHSIKDLITVDIPDSCSSDALFRAIVSSSIDEIKSLLQEYPQLIRTETFAGDLPIHWATSSGRKDVILLLLEKDRELKNAKDIFGNYPIHLAVNRGHKEIVEFFLEIDPELKRAKNVYGNTPIHMAAHHGNKDIVQMLLDVDLELMNEKNNIGYFPIHIAASHGHVEIVRMFLEKDPDLKYAKDNHGNYPIHEASYRGCKEVVELFLDDDPELKNAKDNYENLPIHKAVINEQIVVIELFLARYPELIKAQDRHGSFLIQKAAAYGKISSIQLLLSIDPESINIKLDNGYSLIHIAAFNGHKEAVRMLLQIDPELRNARDKKGNYPIHEAAYNGRNEIVGLFLAFDPELKNAKLANGLLPIHIAIDRGHQEVVLFLMWAELLKPTATEPMTLVGAVKKNGVINKSIIESYNKISESILMLSKRPTSLDMLKKMVHYMKFTQNYILPHDPEGINFIMISPTHLVKRTIKALTRAIANIKVTIDSKSPSNSGPTPSCSSSEPQVSNDSLSSEVVAAIKNTLAFLSSAFVIINQYANLDKRFGMSHKQNIARINALREQVTSLSSKLTNLEETLRKRTERSSIDLQDEPWELLVQLGLRTEKDFQTMLNQVTPKQLVETHKLETIGDYRNIGVYIPNSHEITVVQEWLTKVESLEVMTSNHSMNINRLKESIAIGDFQGIRVETEILRLELLKAFLNGKSEKIKKAFTELESEDLNPKRQRTG